MLAFVHIHKCGGSSLQELIRSNFRRKKHKSVKLSDEDLHLIPKDLKNSIVQRASADGYIMGHFAYGVHRLFSDPCEYTTMLRKPKERLISLYRHAKVSPTAYYHQQAKSQSFGEFLTRGSVLEADNGMVRFLSGDADERNLFINPKPFGSLDESDLERAFVNLEAKFATFGLLERFDQSLLLWKQAIGMSNCYYTRINTTPSQVERPAFTSDFFDLIRFDEALYEKAEVLFEKRLSELGLDDDKLLQDFRRENQKKQPWLKMKDELKSFSANCLKKLGRK